MNKGYVQVYTGDGKGKTTASLGLALRAVGRGMRVVMVQFLKGVYTGELTAAQRLCPDFQIIRMAETDKFIFELNDDEKSKLHYKLKLELEQLKSLIEAQLCDVLILDEAMGLIHSGMVTIDELCSIIEIKPDNMELILTGRCAPKEIIDRADLVTEMKCIKHYCDAGVDAREGIEL